MSCICTVHALHSMHSRPCYAMPCFATLHHATPCYAMLCHAMPCHAMPCHGVLCYAVLCGALLCCAKLRCSTMRCADVNVLWSGVQPVARGTLSSLLDGTGCLPGSSQLALPARQTLLAKQHSSLWFAVGPSLLGTSCAMKAFKGQSLWSTTTNKDDTHDNSSNGNNNSSNINFTITISNSNMIMVIVI